VDKQTARLLVNPPMRIHGQPDEVKSKNKLRGCRNRWTDTEVSKIRKAGFKKDVLE
jgi:hypothetical protein